MKIYNYNKLVKAVTDVSETHLYFNTLSHFHVDTQTMAPLVELQTIKHHSQSILILFIYLFIWKNFWSTFPWKHK